MSRMDTRECLMILVTAVGCGASASPTPGTGAGSVQACVSQYASSNGFDYQDDLGANTVAPDGQAPVQPSSLDEAVSECLSGGNVQPETDAGAPAAPAEAGSDCDATKIMTHDAALCVARASGLTEGLSGLKAGLVYHVGYRRILWYVINKTRDDGNGQQGGDEMDIDAITGAVLFRGGWSATP